MSEEDLDYKRVLRKSLTTLIEDIEPTLILDEFIVHDFLLPTQIRDIQESGKTSDQNRAIYDAVYRKGLSGYLKFKEILRDAHHEHLVDYLENLETEVGGKRKVDVEAKVKYPDQETGCNGREAAGKVMNIGEHNSTNKYQKVVNIGGSNSINIFGGTSTITGAIHLGGNGVPGGVYVTPGAPFSMPPSAPPSYHSQQPVQGGNFFHPQLHGYSQPGHPPYIHGYQPPQSAYHYGYVHPHQDHYPQQALSQQLAHMHLDSDKQDSTKQTHQTSIKSTVPSEYN